MAMRTDDLALFGSYHPNDLVQTIVDYFKHGSHDNQWGMTVYNPNGAVNQYIGTVKSPGMLGPDSEHQYKGYTQPDGNSAMFNPNALNNQLFHSAPSMSGSNYQNSQSSASASEVNTHNARPELPFDADQLNKELMQNSDNTAIQKIPDTYHPDGPIHTTTQQNPHQQVGFNPDLLNAGLFSAVKYDPNSVNAAFDGSIIGSNNLFHTGIDNTASGKENESSNKSSATETDNSIPVPNVGDSVHNGNGVANGESVITTTKPPTMAGGMFAADARVNKTAEFLPGGIGVTGSYTEGGQYVPSLGSGYIGEQIDESVPDVHGIGGMG